MERGKVRHGASKKFRQQGSQAVESEVVSCLTFFWQGTSSTTCALLQSLRAVSPRLVTAWLSELPPCPIWFAVWKD
jgi:hypothetical protein